MSAEKDTYVLQEKVKEKKNKNLPYYIINVVPVYSFKPLRRKTHSNYVWINI